MINLILKERVDNFKFVTVQFAGSNTQRYTYKTTLSLKEGDFVVVDAPSGLTVVTVVDPDVEVTESPKFDIKWIVSKVDVQGYKYYLGREKELKAELNSNGVKVARL